LSLSEEEKARGVITVSSGNHGRAVAYAARSLGIKATVCLAETVARNKLENIKKLGPEVVVQGKGYDEAVEHSMKIQEKSGLTYLHPFDDPVVIAGQGTVGLEIVESLPEVDSVLVPLSGGGLISGVALAMKAANPGIRVIGVTMEAAPVMYHSLKAGEIVEMEEEPTIADALPGGLGPENFYTFRMCQELLDDAVLVSEEEIAAAMAFALQEHRLVVEGGAAVGIAAAMQQRAGDLGERAAVVVSGSNVDLPLLLKIAQEHGAGN
jgi:threonine dehydratase